MVIFGTGVVTGGLLVRFVEHSRAHRPQHVANAPHPAQPSPAAGSRIDLLRRLERELDLTPEQREPIDKIIKEGQERTKKLMETVEPRRREEFKRTMEEFRVALTPEQRTRFDELVKQQQQHAREQRKAAPPREPAPQVSPANTNS